MIRRYHQGQEPLRSNHWKRTNRKLNDKFRRPHQRTGQATTVSRKIAQNQGTGAKKREETHLTGIDSEADKDKTEITGLPQTLEQLQLRRNHNLRPVLPRCTAATYFQIPMGPQPSLLLRPMSKIAHHGGLGSFCSAARLELICFSSFYFFSSFFLPQSWQGVKFHRLLRHISFLRSLTSLTRSMIAMYKTSRVTRHHLAQHILKDKAIKGRNR